MALSSSPRCRPPARRSQVRAMSAASPATRQPCSRFPWSSPTLEEVLVHLAPVLLGDEHGGVFFEAVSRWVGAQLDSPNCSRSGAAGSPVRAQRPAIMRTTAVLHLHCSVPRCTHLLLATGELKRPSAAGAGALYTPGRPVRGRRAVPGARATSLELTAGQAPAPIACFSERTRPSRPFSRAHPAAKAPPQHPKELAGLLQTAPAARHPHRSRLLSRHGAHQEGGSPHAWHLQIGAGRCCCRRRPARPPALPLPAS